MKSEDIKSRQWTEKERQAARRIAQIQAARDDSDIDFGDVPRLVPRLNAWPGATKKAFDVQAAGGEWRLALVLAAVWGVFCAVAALRWRAAAVWR